MIGPTQICRDAGSRHHYILALGVEVSDWVGPASASLSQRQNVVMPAAGITTFFVSPTYGDSLPVWPTAIPCWSDLRRFLAGLTYGELFSA
jgi:hypothetical protein